MHFEGDLLIGSAKGHGETEIFLISESRLIFIAPEDDIFPRRHYVMNICRFDLETKYNNIITVS